MTVINRDGDTRNDGQVLGFRFEMALLYAFRLHAKQKRKGGEIPYIGHLLGVTSLVIENGGGEDEAIAALLHDAVEDQGGEEARQAIESLFGPNVAAIVVACSDKAPDSYERTRENWCVRKEAYLDHLRCQDPPVPVAVLRVSLADKVYNTRTILFDLRDLGPSLWSRFNQGREDQLWYFRELVKAFQSAPNAEPLQGLRRELADVVTAIEQEAQRSSRAEEGHGGVEVTRLQEGPS